jgi:mannose-6-phosphate isomerase-like protein (cupin superfamily)
MIGGVREIDCAASIGQILSITRCSACYPGRGAIDVSPGANWKCANVPPAMKHRTVEEIWHFLSGTERCGGARSRARP